MSRMKQADLFLDPKQVKRRKALSGTFTNNMKLPVHRWYRFSAGFSAEWVESVLESSGSPDNLVVFDPFAGSGTTLLAASGLGFQSIGIEAHPFIYRIADAKLQCSTDPQKLLALSVQILEHAKSMEADITGYPDLINKCFEEDNLRELDAIRRSLVVYQDDSPEWKLAWLALVACLRSTSHVGTAQWQYVLPNKTKSKTLSPRFAYESTINMFVRDMQNSDHALMGKVSVLNSDARTCEGVGDQSVDLVVTSPPYPNNYDYADATRLEMSFLKEIAGWGDLQSKVRKYLVRACSQHVPVKAVDLESVLESPELLPIINELEPIVRELEELRHTKGGKKTYHLMVACYFLDLAQTWLSLRRVCKSPSKVCFVIGDSAPYGVYVPAVEWLGKLALAAGFHSWTFEKTRDRNIKWKNRKHRVPLCEGRLWVEG